MNVRSKKEVVTEVFSFKKFRLVSKKLLLEHRELEVVKKSLSFE
ncbi:hypothetical protein HMPREF1348_01151, partial [Enterococcus faecium 505]